MKSKATVIARVLLGLVFFVFGLNGFLNFLEPPEMTPEAEAFITALADTGYLLYLLKFVETLCGAMLLAGLFAPLALILLTPIVINIAAFHIFLDPAAQGLVTVVVILALHIFLTTQFWSVYKPVLVVRPDFMNNQAATTAETTQAN